MTPANLPAGKPWVFEHPFFILLNVAVGGNWPGNPDATTHFRSKCWSIGSESPSASNVRHPLRR